MPPLPSTRSTRYFPAITLPIAIPIGREALPAPIVSKRDPISSFEQFQQDLFRPLKPRSTRRPLRYGRPLTTIPAMESEAHDSTTDDTGRLETEHPLRTAILWVNAENEPRVSWLTGRDDLLVGRDSQCDVELPSTRISRRHARLRRTGSSWFVQDLDSRNGVSLNGEPVQQAALSEGDVLRLGSWIGLVLDFHADEESRYELFDEDLYGGPDLRALLDLVTVAANSGLPVVLEGPTGTGKEQFARAIHCRGRRSGAFLAINCAVYQPATAAAELFGYRRGAFTGADRHHPGLIRAAEGGTLLLDEIADLPYEVQTQLLRAIENREIIPLGESHPVQVNVRFLSATQAPLSHAVEKGRFRADLRARLEGLRIVIPPLNERRGDVPLLFLHLLRQHAKDPPLPDGRVLEQLSLYDWPLNVREMVSLVRRVLAAHPGATSLSLPQVQALFPDLVRAPAAPEQNARSVRRRRADPRAFTPGDLAALEAALERQAGHVAAAAAELGISRQRAYRMLKQLRK
jgi:transcriptional regulator with AAA-type ATPase domain